MILAPGIFEAMSLQKFIGFIEVTDIHPHCRHILRHGFNSRNVHIESIRILHPNAGDILVINIVFLMTSFETKFLKKTDNLLRLRGQNHRVKCCNLHQQPPSLKTEKQRDPESSARPRCHKCIFISVFPGCQVILSINSLTG